MTVEAIQYPLHPLGFGVRVLQWGMEGPPALFVHGLGSHAEIWAPVASALAERGRRCFAIDLPGHGLSQKGEDPTGRFAYTADGHAALFAALAPMLGDGPLDVVGSSLGGLHGAAFATSHPDLVRTLTLIGSVGLQPLEPERREWTAEYLSRMDRAAVAGRLRAGVFDPAAVSESFIEEAHRMNNSHGAAESFAAIARYYRTTINDDTQVERLAGLTGRVPLLLIWGRQDVTVRYDGAVAALPRLPGCTLLALDETKHIPHIERPDSVIRALAAHWEGRELAGLAGPGVTVTASAA